MLVIRDDDCILDVDEIVRVLDVDSEVVTVLELEMARVVSVEKLLSVVKTIDDLVTLGVKEGWRVLDVNKALLVNGVEVASPVPDEYVYALDALLGVLGIGAQDDLVATGPPTVRASRTGSVSARRPD